MKSMNFRIEKENIGPIKLETTIGEAEKYLKKFKKETAEAYDFGFDCGGNSYIYFKDNSPFIALVPKMDSDTIFAIIALNKNLKMKNGLHPNSS